MRIALVGVALPPIMGGLEIHIFELAKHLAGAGHEVHVFGVRRYRGRELPAEEVRDGVAIHRFGGTVTVHSYEWYEAVHLAIGRRLAEMRRRGELDVAHGHTVYPSGISCWVARQLSGMPYVITSHGDEIMEFPRNPLYRAMKLRGIRTIFHGASRVIAVSEELRQLSIRYGADAARCMRLSNVVDLSRFQNGGEKDAYRQRLGLPLHRPICLSLRRLSLKNGVQYLIEAVPRVVKEVPDVLFLICGDGDMRERLIQRVDELGLHENVRFQGTVPNDVVQEYIHAADLAAFPSLAEATSIACLEVMACGVPVVSSDVGGLPEIVQDGRTGILVPFHLQASTFQDPGLPSTTVAALAEAISRLARDHALRIQMGQQAAEVVHSCHSWQAYVQTIVHDVYAKAR